MVRTIGIFSVKENMTSYDSILKWAIEAQKLLKEGNLAGVKTNLSMIVSQAKEETKSHVPVS